MLHNLLHSDAARLALLLAGFGSLLYLRFKETGDLVDLNDAILMLEGLDGRIPKLMCLSIIGGALSGRFQRLGDLGDIEPSRKTNLAKQPSSWEPVILLLRTPWLGYLVDIEKCWRRQFVFLLITIRTNEIR